MSDETTDSLLNMESIDFGSIPAGLGAAGIAGAGTVQLVGGSDVGRYHVIITSIPTKRKSNTQSRGYWHFSALLAALYTSR